MQEGTCGIQAGFPQEVHTHKMAPNVGQRSGEQFIMRKEFRQGSKSGFGSGCRPAVLDNSREPGTAESRT